MRLTLRTLLAYLDDILPPAETKELGEKIAASPVASQLVDRIRDVMRRRRLTAPETDGSGGGIEPNLVAEYLDNLLPPERVADVERVCLESDVNLAEVAACHQVLTLVLGEPVEIPNRLRERMYALGPQGTPLEVPGNGVPRKGGPEATAREQLAAIQTAQKAKPVTPGKISGSRVPDYLRTKPLWKRVLPWMIVPLLLLAYAGLFWFDPTFRPGGQGKKAEPAVAAKAKERDARAAATDPRDEEPSGEAAAATAIAASGTELLDLPVDPEPPVDEAPVTEETIAASPPDQGEPSPDAVASATRSTGPEPAGPTAEPSDAAEASAPGTPPVVDGAAPALDVFSTDGVVLRFDPASGQWFPLAADQAPPAGVSVAVPEPFRADLKIENLPLLVQAFGGTRLTPFGKTEAADAGFDVAQGRLRITGDTAAANDATKMMFALRLGEGLWRVEPLTPETVVGIEALPLQPSGEGQDLSGRTPQGVIYVSAGAARVADATDRVEVVSAGNRLILAPSNGGGMSPAEAASAAVESPTEAAPDAEADPTPEAVVTEDPTAAAESPDAPAEQTPAAEAAAVESLAPFAMPDWVAAPREPTASARRMATAFEGEFLPDATASASLVPAVRNRNFNIAEPAAKALALIEDADGLVRTLRDAEQQGAMLAAVEGLRNWLGRSPANGEVLREQLGATFGREGLADALYEMLWGYDAEDARDTPTAERLVEWLAHPEPLVRQLAFYHVKRLSGRTLNYNPLATEGQRSGAMNSWRTFVGRHGGLVVSE